MNPKRLCKCGCGGSMGASARQRQFLPKCAAKRQSQYRAAYYAKNRISIKAKHHRKPADTPPEVLQAPKSKTITAADVEAAMKWGWCPRHPDWKAAFQGLCPACAVKGRA